MRSGSLAGWAASRKARKIFASPSEIMELGVPLHADAEAVLRRLDALDHAVRGERR